MWRREGDGEVYAYMPNQQVAFHDGDIILMTMVMVVTMMMVMVKVMTMMMMVLQVDGFCEEPDVHCNFDYGHSLGRGSWRFK